MKKILIVALALCMCIGVTGCKKTDEKDSGKKSPASKTESTSAIGNYMLVESNLDSSDVANNEFIFAGEEGLITLKGFRSIENFYYGYAVAHNADYKINIINTKGKEMLPTEKYDSIRNIDSAYGSKLFIVKSAETNLYGIIDANGKEIIKCEYDIIEINSTNTSYRQSAYVFKCKNDDTVDVFTETGKKLYFNDEIYKWGFISNEQNKRIIVIATKEDQFYYNASTGDFLFKSSDYGDSFNWAYALRVANYKNDKNEYEAVVFSEDGSKAIKTGLPYVSSARCFGDYILLDYSSSGTAIFDNNGNEKHYFQKDVTPSFDYKGNVSYLMKSAGMYVLYNKDFEQVAEIKGARNVNSGHGFFYSIPSDGDKTNCTMYDSNGKVIYEQVTMVDFLHRERSIFKLSDGSNACKSVYNKDMVVGGQNETYKSSYMDSNVIVFTNENGEYILRDAQLKELCRLDGFSDFLAPFNLFGANGNLYNKNGKLIYENKQ